MNSTKLRVIALDLDNTLLRTDLSLSYKTRMLIKRLVEAGLTVVLASGRIPEAMEKYVRLLGLHKAHSYLISNNGALITESNTGHIVHEMLLDRETLLKICDLAHSEDFPLQMYDDNITYISRKNEYSAMDEKITGLRQVVVENFRSLVGEACYKLIIPGDTEHLACVETLIRTYIDSKLSFFTSRKYFLQISREGANKGSALEKIANINFIRQEEVMAIGDSINDEAMIRWAGVGVAMANGDERIKSIASHITKKTNDEDGVADFLENYFFGQ